MESVTRRYTAATAAVLAAAGVFGATLAMGNHDVAEPTVADVQLTAGALDDVLTTISGFENELLSGAFNATFVPLNDATDGAVFDLFGITSAAEGGEGWYSLFNGAGSHLVNLINSPLMLAGVGLAAIDENLVDASTLDAFWFGPSADVPSLGLGYPVVELSSILNDLGGYVLGFPDAVGGLLDLGDVANIF